MKGKELGAVLLVAGCSIGAGMLGVPVITGPCGFIPAVVCFFLAWLFMLTTGLVLVDLVLDAQKREDKQGAQEVHLITLASRSFGRGGVFFVWFLFSFLFYCVMTAYMLGGGSLLFDALSGHISSNMALIAVAAFGAIVVCYGAQVLDKLNRFLMLGLILAYLALIFTAIPHIDTTHLVRASWAFAPICLPLMIISFGYHNLVPSLVSYLDRDRRAIRRAIIIGSAIPLLVYIVWEIAILGVIPYSSAQAWQEAVKSGDMVTRVLAKASGFPWVIRASEAFAFFALVTSFLPVSWSFVDFLKDAAREMGIKKSKNVYFIICVFIPPLIVALTEPHLFLQALSAAGGYAAVTLFGILPALMAYKLKLRSRGLMVVLILFALFVMGVEVQQTLGG